MKSPKIQLSSMFSSTEAHFGQKNNYILLNIEYIVFGLTLLGGPLLAVEKSINFTRLGLCTSYLKFD